MSADAFLDTNVLAYSFDPRFPAKQEKARKLIASDRWVVSWQVIQEFANLALHRFAVPMKPEDLSDYLKLILWPRCAALPSASLHLAALRIHHETQYRFYDSLIIAAALASGARVLYTEDLQEGRTIGSLTIRNPFSV